MITRVKDNVRLKTTVWQGFYSRTTKMLAILKIKVLIAFIFMYGILAIFKMSLNKNSAKVIHYI